MKNLLIAVLVLIKLVTHAQSIVYNNGSLKYLPDEKGNTFPDFSQVGYPGAIPYIALVKTVKPGDNIQSAIDEVSKLPVNKDGFRGAILLQKGIYKIPGTIRITASGIILRGEGPGTKLIATGRGQRSLIFAAGQGEIKEIPNTRRKITDTYVPVGATTFTVSSTAGLLAGDRIIVFRPGTQKWIHDLQMDQIEVRDSTSKQWQPSEYNLRFERTITRIDKNKICIDNPIVMALDEQYGGGDIYKYSFDGRINNVGVENMLCESDYAHPTDEDHGWNAVLFNRMENGWVKNVTARHFGYSCVNLGAQARNITVDSCQYLEPRSQITGSRRYSFNNDGQLNLVMNCFASEGRHDFVTGARVCGPNVFYNCRAENAKADIGPHHRWSMGTLYDNIVTDGEINIQDRGNWGTGHGWAGVNQVVWNCTASKAAIQDPWVSGKNYVIGLKARPNEGRLKGRQATTWKQLDGLPVSLYQAQLNNKKRTVTVKDASELNSANQSAQPGDTIILQNGPWTNTRLHLTCSGTAGKPIVFKAQTPGKVIIDGISDLRLAGDYIIVDGLLFTNGHSPSHAVIAFTGNHCRVTNCVIDNFNKPKRLDTDEWITFSGKHNRLDHGRFQNKKNMGTVLAVLLGDDQSRENFHSIDHNYFGRRIPLASNGGEIIRIGLAQHCQFNSNTQVNDNLFEYCDGEAEVISIKSGSNIVSNNVFKECQGSVVLRHGDNNTVTNNTFIGNGKEATGGVRVVNKGQWIINNYFYRCRGEGFRAPLSIMNGVPNSPPTRYVQVTDAVIMNNAFIECAPVSIGEGSDKERSLPPAHVMFANNVFRNRQDTAIYTVWDDTSGIFFLNNKVNAMAPPPAPAYTLQKGPGWYKPASSNTKPITINCNTPTDLYRALEKQQNPLLIRLTGSTYTFDKPLIITGRVEISSANQIDLSSSTGLPALFIVQGHLSLKNVHITASNLKATSFIDTDTAHYSVTMHRVTINHLPATILNARESTLADSIIVQQCHFNDIKNGFLLAAEKTSKGYYNVENIRLLNNQFTNGQGILLDLLRGGTDESTLGPKLTFTNNQVSGYSNNGPLIGLTGVQKSIFKGNRFTNCNPNSALIVYKDFVRATHYLAQNTFTNCGQVETNEYVQYDIHRR